MKRYAAFTARFALAPIVSGPFAVEHAAGMERAHAIAGVASIYAIFGLVLLSVRHREMRVPAWLALGTGLVEVVPGLPQLHAAMAPVLFAALVWAVMARPRAEETAGATSGGLIPLLPFLVLLPIVLGVKYRQQTGGFLPHIAMAMPVAGVLVVAGFALSQRYAGNTALRRVCQQLIAVVLVQIVFGMVVFIIRLLEVPGGLLLTVARTGHIVGAAPVLGICTALAIQYRRGQV